MRVVFACVLVVALAASCDRARNNEDRVLADPEIDTVLIRDTLVVVDTMLVEREIIKTISVTDTLFVEKVVEVPAEIPELYVAAAGRFLDEAKAEYAYEKTCFYGLDSLAVSVSINSEMETLISNQRLRNKVELTLRQYGVPIGAWSDPGLNFSIDGLWVRNKFDEKKMGVAFMVTVALMEPIVFYRDGKPYRRYVNTWEDQSLLLSGRDEIKESLLQSIVEKAEHVANLYLKAN